MRDTGVPRECTGIDYDAGNSIVFYEPCAAIRTLHNYGLKITMELYGLQWRSWGGAKGHLPWAPPRGGAKSCHV